MAWILTWVVGILESRVGLGGCADAGGCVVVRALGVQDVVPGISVQPSLSGVLIMCGGGGIECGDGGHVGVTDVGSGVGCRVVPILEVLEVGRIVCRTLNQLRRIFYSHLMN